MKCRKTAAILMAAAVTLSAAGAAAASDTAGGGSSIQIIGAAGTESAGSETEAPIISQGSVQGDSSSKSEDDAAGKASVRLTDNEAASQARTLYSQLEHYAEEQNREEFGKLFASDVTDEQISAQFDALSAAAAQTSGLSLHADACYYNSAEDSSAAGGADLCGVGLTDYSVAEDGSVTWYSSLLCITCEDGVWKVAAMPEGSLMESLYPEGYRAAVKAGRNAADIYPYLALRFSGSGLFEGAFYSLANMAWENEDGSLSVSLWIANGTQGTKWCDSVDLVIRSGEDGIAAVNVPVQQVAEAGSSVLSTVTIPADSVSSGASWDSVTIQSNLLYE